MSLAVEVRAFPRIHITLIDVAGVTKRRFGGAGFSLDAQPVVVEVQRSTKNQLFLRLNLAKADEADLWSLVDRLGRVLGTGFAVTVSSAPPQHVGFGSKTSTLMAIATACNRLLNQPLNREELKKVSGRGGASGVGVNVFFCGGFVTDLGHPVSGGPSFAPSSASVPSSPPPLGTQLPFPEYWKVHLFLPQGRRYWGGEEVSFFESNTPIARDEALRVLAAVYHGVVPAVICHDLPLLKEAITEIHSVGFKKREVDGQNEDVRLILSTLNKCDGVVAGMSSMGPLVYAIASADADGKVERVSWAVREASAAVYLGAYRGRNSGYECRD